MSTPRTLTITISTDDDNHPIQAIDITCDFDPAVQSGEVSFLATIARALIGTIKEIQCDQELSLGGQEHDQYSRI